MSELNVPWFNNLGVLWESDVHADKPFTSSDPSWSFMPLGFNCNIIINFIFYKYIYNKKNNYIITYNYFLLFLFYNARESIIAFISGKSEEILYFNFCNFLKSSSSILIA